MAVAAPDSSRVKPINTSTGIEVDKDKIDSGETAWKQALQVSISANSSIITDVYPNERPRHLVGTAITMRVRWKDPDDVYE